MLAMAPLMSFSLNPVVTGSTPPTSSNASESSPLDQFAPSNSADTGLYNLKSLRAHAQVTPQVADGGSAGEVEAGTPESRTAFLGKMKSAGIKASNPPTPEQLHTYFKTFNSAEKRSQALDALQDYSGAFHVHAAKTGNDEDIHYSKDQKQFGWNHHVYKTEREANAAADAAGPSHRDDKITDIQTYDASSWKDVTTGRRSYQGRLVQDCEGFAFMAQDLLGAAGYQTKQVATQGDQGYAHALMLATDPDSGKEAVASNGQIFDDPDRDQALQHAWNQATAWKNQGHGDWYFGATQTEAQAHMVMEG